ncbi:MAG: hypothetical protein M1812_004503 [Candelaria pacifica]|nr:MAG: hypothetical protein M1812_004503 [Candelaria pacifica]
MSSPPSGQGNSYRTPYNSQGGDPFPPLFPEQPTTPVLQQRAVNASQVHPGPTTTHTGSSSAEQPRTPVLQQRAINAGQNLPATITRTGSNSSQNRPTFLSPATTQARRHSQGPSNQNRFTGFPSNQPGTSPFQSRPNPGPTMNTSPAGQPRTAPPGTMQGRQSVRTPQLFRVLELNGSFSDHTRMSIMQNCQPGAFGMVYYADPERGIEEEFVCFVRHPRPTPSQPAHAPFRAPHEAVFGQHYQFEGGQQTTQGQTVQTEQQQAPPPPMPKYKCIERDRSVRWREAQDIYLWCQPGFCNGAERCVDVVKWEDDQENIVHSWGMIQMVRYMD